MANPFHGSSSATWYVEEITPNVTPVSPAWKKLRSTGGIPTIAKDTLQSEELDESRETKSIRTGNESATGEYSIELSHGSQDDLLANAMSSSWEAGFADTGLSVTVADAGKTFTRASGSFLTDAIEVGDLVQFVDLTGNNALPFIATAVSALVLTGAAITKTLVDEATVTTDYASGDKLGTGNECKTVSILTELKGKCGTSTVYILTTGVEFTGWSIDVSVNATVTGSFPLIGRDQTEDVAAPAGSTFTETTTRPYTSVDSKVIESGVVQGGVTSIAYANDNNTSPQYELGSKSVSFVERGTANNTITASMFMFDTELLNKFLNETTVDIAVILNHPDGGAMSFSTPRTVLTEVTPELGAGSVTQSVSGTAIGSSLQSSIVIQRLPIV
jgi:hypothetical protein